MSNTIGWASFGLILCLISRGVCQTTAIEGWLNSPESPLQIELSPKKNGLTVANYSNKAVKSYRLGCVSKQQNHMRVEKRFKRVDSKGLEPRNAENVSFESLGDEYFESNVCSKGRLAVIKVSFVDRTSYEIRLEQ